MTDLIRRNDALDILCKSCGITEDVEKCRKTSADGWCKEYCELKNMPTVEAIPVEWIRKYTEENRLYQSDDFDIYINDMIADWADEKKDIRICGICKHFLGGGDFGTCCDQTYELKYRDSKVCEKYSERKEE